MVQQDAGFRLLSRAEGEALVWMAWELRRGLGAKPDCSHFVNLVYEHAGLDYEYASTFEIFDGIPAFRRVKLPQPGDLVVWRGHMGMVVDPDEHSFYSSVNKGFAIENYRSGYWTNRGKSRFYRYVMDEVHSARLAAHVTTLPFMFLASEFLFGGQLPAKTDGDLGNSNGQPEHNAPIPKPPVAQQSVAKQSIAKQSIAKPPIEKQSIAKQSIAKQSIAKPPIEKQSVAKQSDDTGIPHEIFVSSNAKPSKEEIGAAVTRLADANGKRLIQLPALPAGRAIVVAEGVKIDELDLDERSGWAELESQEEDPSRCPRRDLNQAGGRWRVALHHEDWGWVLLASQDRIYLRRATAARVLAHQTSTDALRAFERPGDPTTCQAAR